MAKTTKDIGIIGVASGCGKVDLPEKWENKETELMLATERADKTCIYKAGKGLQTRS